MAEKRNPDLATGMLRTGQKLVDLRCVFVILHIFRGLCSHDILMEFHSKLENISKNILCDFCRAPLQTATPDPHPRPLSPDI